VGSESLLTFGEIRKKPGFYCNVVWISRRFKVEAPGDVFINDGAAPGEWIILSPHRSAWGTPDREFYPEPTVPIENYKVYENRHGHLYYKVGDRWLYDYNRGSLDKGGTQGTIIACHTPNEAELTELPGVRLGFYRAPAPSLLTFAEIRKTPGVYDDVKDLGAVVVVNAISQATLVDKEGSVVHLQPTGWDTPDRRFKPSTKKVKVTA
jgi:hypothetical protein